MSFQENIDIDEYTMEKIADSDCTPDDIYSWDAPFDSSQTIQLWWPQPYFMITVEIFSPYILKYPIGLPRVSERLSPIKT